MNRRKFLQTGTTSALGIVSGLSSVTCHADKEKEYLERAAEFLAGTLTVDLHSHAGALEGRGVTEDIIFKYVGDEREKMIFDEMIRAFLKASYLCITSDWNLMDLGSSGNMKRSFRPGEAWAEYLRQISIFKDPGLQEMMPIELALKVEEIEPIRERGKLAVFLSTEGGHMVEDGIDRLERLYQDGIRKFQPIHYVATLLGDSQTDPPKYGGLSDLGKEAVREASRLGMIIDAAHASFDCTRQIAEVSGAPLILSHSMMLFDSYDHPRWISPDHARLIAETGGVIGTWPVPKPHGFDSLDDFIDAVLEMIDTVGIDHVGWSSDYIGGHLDDSPVFNNYRQFPEVVAKLMMKGLSNEELTKLVGGNALRVHKEVCKK